MDMKKWTTGMISGQVPQTHRRTQKIKLPFRCLLLRTRELVFHTLVAICHNYRDTGNLGETLKASVIASYCCLAQLNNNSCVQLFSPSCVQLFCKSLDCSPPGSSVHGIYQARILQWVAISFSRDLPNPGIEPSAPALTDGFFTSEPSGKML